MKETEILFKAPMVRATLDDSKTHTRRVVDRLKGFGKITEFQPATTKGYDWTFRDKRALWNEIRHDRLMECCPYGKPGDRLWVRETWKADFAWDNLKPVDIPHGEPVLYLADEESTGVIPFEWGKTRVSIHMPRWASRITLEITNIRVERLNDISEEDALAEGIEVFEDGAGYTIPLRNGKKGSWVRSPYSAFANLWESINGSESWKANPLVWVIEFKRVEGGAA